MCTLKVIESTKFCFEYSLRVSILLDIMSINRENMSSKWTTKSSKGTVLKLKILLTEGSVH